MTNTEKFILKEKGAKEIVMSIVSVFDGKSYKFANAALNAAKTFLNEDSTFTASTALKKIAALSDTPAPEIPAKKNSK